MDTTAGAQRNAAAIGSQAMVKVVLMGELKRWAGARDVEVELPPGSTVHVLAQKLSALCGAAFAQHAMTKQGALQPHVAVFINGEQLADHKAIIAGGSVELMMLPMYEGGT